MIHLKAPRKISRNTPKDTEGKFQSEVKSTTLGRLDDRSVAIKERSRLTLTDLGNDSDEAVIALGAGIGATGSKGAVVVWLLVRDCRAAIIWSLNAVKPNWLALRRWSCSWSSRFSFSKPTMRSIVARSDCKRWPGWVHSSSSVLMRSASTFIGWADSWAAYLEISNDRSRGVEQKI